MKRAKASGQPEVSLLASTNTDEEAGNTVHVPRIEVTLPAFGEQTFLFPQSFPSQEAALAYASATTHMLAGQIETLLAHAGWEIDKWAGEEKEVVQ